jgi:hypothetical protein
LHPGSSESAETDEHEEMAVEDAEEAAYVKKCSGDHTPSLRRPYVDSESHP